MKKALSLILSFLLCMGLGMNVYADETDKTMANGPNDLISLEELRDLFPQVSLGADGYIASNASARTFKRSSDIVEDLNYLAKNISDPVQVYTANYNGGVCILNIYDNDMYAAYGYEEVNVSDGAGYESLGGSKYRSYFRMSLAGFSYTYNHTTTSGLSKFSDLSHVSPLVGSGLVFTVAPGQTGYTRATQSGSNAAEIYGDATFNYTANPSGYPYSVDVRLVTNGKNGSISVTNTVPY